MHAYEPLIGRVKNVGSYASIRASTVQVMELGVKISDLVQLFWTNRKGRIFSALIVSIFLPQPK